MHPNLSEEIRQTCANNHIKLNKELGQNFLTEKTVLDSIVEAASLANEDHVVEIGPGIGVLTRELVQRVQTVTAIEIDKRFPPIIESFIASSQLSTSTLNIINQNALQTPFPSTPYKIVANIPYHITSPLLRHAFLESTIPPTSLTLLIQREVAEKICDERSAGLLTILVRLFGEPRMVTHLPPDCFLPPPKVDSAVLHIDCFSEPLAPPEVIEEVFRLTKIAFAQKRKMLRNSFAAFHDVLDQAKELGIAENKRPQECSIQEWIALATRVREAQDNA